MNLRVLLNFGAFQICWFGDSYWGCSKFTNDDAGSNIGYFY